ncbi:hypothetical protein V6N13_048470 [Hibiscus sabdariffa]
MRTEEEEGSVEAEALGADTDPVSIAAEPLPTAESFAAEGAGIGDCRVGEIIGAEASLEGRTPVDEPEGNTDGEPASHAHKMLLVDIEGVACHTTQVVHPGVRIICVQRGRTSRGG